MVWTHRHPNRMPFIRGVYERSDAPVRAKEGLDPRCGMLAGEHAATAE